jgi:hypothetical protein
MSKAASRAVAIPTKASAVPETIRVPDAVDAALTEAAQDALDLVRNFNIDSADMYEIAAIELRGIVTKKDELEAERFAITRPMDAAKKKVMNLFRAPITWLEQAEAILKQKMVAFDRSERDRIAAEERQALAAADAERKRVEEAGLARAAEIEALESAQAEELATELEQLGESTEAQLVRETAKAEAAQKADEVLREAAADAQMIVAFVPQAEAPRADGIGKRETWHAEVTDMDALIRAAAEGNKSARECLMANESVLGAKARSLKKAFALPGVRVWSESGISARRA